MQNVRPLKRCIIVVILLVLASVGNARTAKSLAQSQGTAKTPAQAIPAVSQAPVPSSQTTDISSSLVLKATTRMVLVDVIATDGHGKPITDLKPEDFVIVEDGKEQRVRTLAFQQPSKDQTAFRPKLSPNVVTNQPTYQGTNTLNVILLDGLNTSTLNQTLARQKMLEFLQKMPADQPIAVYTLGSKLRILQDFTTDPAILQKAIKDLALESNSLNKKSAALDEELPPGYFDSIADPKVKEDLLRFEAERVSVQTDLRVGYLTDSLQALARRLAGFPGRKNLIWISEAFPMSINPDVALGTSAFSASRSYEYEVAKTINALVDAQVALYPVDARGLSGGSLSESSTNGNDRLGRTNTSGAAITRALAERDVEVTSPQQLMNNLADRTGGKALYNRNDLENAIEASIADGSTYYLVGYYPENKNWTGKFRKIQVKLNRPGAKLRYRLGYYAVDPDLYTKLDPKQRSVEFLRALSSDLPIATALKFEAGFTSPTAQTNSKLGIKYTVDARALFFELATDGLNHAEVECAVKVYSEKGKFLKFDIDTMSAAVKPEALSALRQRGFPCEQAIELPKGNYWLRLGVRDTRTGLIGTANAKIAVP